nr:hypothetical protein B456_001G191200 [Ipomoea batatas]
MSLPNCRIEFRLSHQPKQKTSLKRSWEFRLIFCSRNLKTGRLLLLVLVRCTVLSCMMEKKSS